MLISSKHIFIPFRINKHLQIDLIFLMSLILSAIICDRINGESRQTTWHAFAAVLYVLKCHKNAQFRVTGFPLLEEKVLINL